MKIIVDISHPAHVNFLKFSLRELEDQGNEILITCLRRGKLPEILQKELSGYTTKFVGSHKGTKISIILDANIKKFINLVSYIWKKDIDLGISVGSFTLGFALKIFGKPNIQFDDDPERKINVFLEKISCTELFFPPVINSRGKIKTMNALKENIAK